MIAKFAALICLFGVVRAGNLYGGAYGGYGGAYGGYGGAYGSGYAIAPSYAAYSTPIVKTIAAPVIAKTIAPVAYAAPIAYSAPAVSSVSQYSVHSGPLVKSYAPVSYAYSSPLIGHSYAPSLSYGYGNLGYSGYGNLGYGGYGKYAW